ncbi:E3 ubiquitin-protein ligase ATL76-like [Phalaenopsis equestris]|uniref:E3 ubiquitin-protein ligase ATL76-like n=1 Tax=Phalaenopsis equestris TaxID=78828 RepID=UPI0009E47EBA|nr:E3 ubiquitin-protein ligase ATL76-like [Phalaenopsis equestris]
MDPSTAISPTPSSQSNILLPPLLLAGGIVAGVAVLLMGFHFLLKKHRHGELDTSPVKFAGDDVKKVLSSIPVLCYTKNELSLTQINYSECSVCLSGIEEGEKVRILPGCGHGFHARCIDAWLRTRLSCPVCRLAVTAPPVVCVEMPLDVEEGGGGNAAAAGKHEDDCSLPV